VESERSIRRATGLSMLNSLRAASLFGANQGWEERRMRTLSEEDEAEREMA
jgi:hypothetical protein